jgi:Ca-activated chloride channel family protein
VQINSQGVKNMTAPRTDAPGLHPATEAPQLVLAPVRSALKEGGSQSFELLIRVQAPDAPPSSPSQVVRPAQALALVIDSSGSMDGRPLEQAKRCAQWVVSKMRSSDRVALVQFDQDVKLLWPAAEVGDGLGLVQAIERIETGGCTALHGGWLEGAKALSRGCSGGLRRVIVLSDGEANEGLTDPSAIAAQCGEWAGQGITTSTYGLGTAFNEDLMVAMARAGGGGHYFGRSADDLMAPFEKELEWLASLCLTEVRMAFKPAAGVSVEVLNDYRQEDGRCVLPDLAFEAEGWALVRVSVSPEAVDLVRLGNPLLDVAVYGRNQQEQAVELKATPLQMPVVSAAAWAELDADELVTRRWTELCAAQALRNMRAAAQKSDWAAVDELLAAAQREFGASQWVRHILDAMQQLVAQRDAQHMGKELLYSATTLSSRLRSKRESALMDADAEASTPSFLRRDVEQGRSGH